VVGKGSNLYVPLYTLLLLYHPVFKINQKPDRNFGIVAGAGRRSGHADIRYAGRYETQIIHDPVRGFTRRRPGIRAGFSQILQWDTRLGNPPLIELTRRSPVNNPGCRVSESAEQTVI